MRKAKKTATATIAPESRARTAAFWLTVSLLVLVPLAFSIGVRRIFCLPKFVTLLVGSAALVPLILLAARRGGELSRLLAARHTAIVWLYLIAVAVSTLFGVAPMASLFGSFENQMGLITQCCFFVCFVGLQVGIGDSRARLERALWAMALTGLLAAAFAFVQFFGYDPFLPVGVYTFNTVAGPVVRVTGTLGHSNYLGNFLLYTAPLSAGLALASRGRARYLALIAAALACAAIAFSGTRGAWVGLGAGVVTFAALELSGGPIASPGARWRQTWRKAGLALLVVVVAVGIISAHPASRNILIRARSFVAEGMTGSGRTLLWRDAIRMAPDFALVGCGPEGFRKAFLAYKSEQLAQFAPQINNESSHNAYLDAAISYGLAGAILYVAIIASTLALMFGARRRATGPGLRAIITGLFSSLVAVITHNIFIFDQIPTGLYFFAFAALGGVVSNLVGIGAGASTDYANSQTTVSAKAVKGKSTTGKLSGIGVARWPGRFIILAGVALIGVALWYAVAVVRADVEIHRAFASAQAGDLDRTIKHGERATRGPDPTGAYDFLFAHALSTCADRLQAASTRAKALDLAITRAEGSLAHTLTPDSSYLLLGYAALRAGNFARLRAYAAEALRLDPNYASAHWLMAESYLADGDRERAAQEAALALKLNPASQEARSVRARAYPRIETPGQKIERLVKRAQELIQDGNTARARRLLLRAIRKSNGPCPECHRLLALVYEATGQYDEAIAEWQMFMREDPARARETPSRIEMLRQKSRQR